MMTVNPARRWDEGFTLVELLIALVVSGMLVAAVFQVLGSQARFSEMQSGREEVQQNARASVELISSELRSIPPGGFTIEDEGRRITFQLPSAWGTLCMHEPGEVWQRVLFPDMPIQTAEEGRLGFVHEDGDVASITYSDIREPTNNTFGSCAALLDNATESSVPVGYHLRRIQSGEYSVLRSSSEKFLDTGTSVFLYRPVTYTVGTSPGVSGVWLRRNGEPLAGPLHGGEKGFKVEPVPGGGGLTLSVVMQSRHQGGVQQVDSASTTIYFRHEGE
jgi:prepilin-type N-terminal cleavage/methylation domain-containing protein